MEKGHTFSLPACSYHTGVFISVDCLQRSEVRFHEAEVKIFMSGKSRGLELNYDL